MKISDLFLLNTVFCKMLFKWRRHFLLFSRSFADTCVKISLPLISSEILARFSGDVVDEHDDVETLRKSTSLNISLRGEGLRDRVLLREYVL